MRKSGVICKTQMVYLAVFHTKLTLFSFAFNPYFVVFTVEFEMTIDLSRRKMQMGEVTMREKIAKRLLQADIRGAHSEMLLFITLFGTAELKQLAKAELSKRTSHAEEDIGNCIADHNFSIAASC